MASDSGFRSWLPDLSQGKFIGISKDDANSWREKAFQVPFLQELVKGWLKLREEPFHGLTNDGNLIPGLFEHEDHGIESAAIAGAAKDLIDMCSSEQLSSLCQPLNSKTWRSWSNPEIYFSPYGLRLEEVPINIMDGILRVVQCTLSPEGYEKVTKARQMNKFLGELCNAPGVLNEYSYNFQIFGQPGEDSQWGWNLFGHHLCINAFINRKQIHISPVFIGAEPNEIDDGPYKGLKLMQPEQNLALSLMQSLSATQKQEARSYEKMHDEKMPPGRWNRADQRHLCGAFQDNRIVPYEGIKVSDLSEDQISMVMSIFREFLLYLPERALQMRLQQIKKHLSETYFSTIGSCRDTEPFYYRIQSPVIVVEFDHHSGVFLRNTEPARFHIHTIVRTPNGGDYGNALREANDRVL